MQLSSTREPEELLSLQICCDLLFFPHTADIPPTSSCALPSTHAQGRATVWGEKVKLFLVIQGRRINKSQKEPLPEKYPGVDVL